MRRYCLILGVLLCSGIALANEEVNYLGNVQTDVTVSGATGFVPSAKLGLNLLSKPGRVAAENARSDTLDNNVTVTSGLGLDYFFNSQFGIFANALYTRRKYDFNPQSQKVISGGASYIDFPLGLALNYGSLLPIPGNVRPVAHVGTYIAAPLNDFRMKGGGEYAGGDAGIIETQTYMGIYLDTEILFTNSSRLAPGLSLWAKLPLGNTLKSQNGIEIESKYYEMGLGVNLAIF